MSKVIAFTSPKGGAGKTTLAAHLGHSLQERGHSVLLIDADPQGSLLSWAEETDGGYPSVIGLHQPKQLARETETMGANYDYVVIDSQGSLGEMIPAALKVADLVLIPIQASALDIWASSDLVELIQARQNVTEGRPTAAFLINRLKPNTRLSRELRDAIGEYGLEILEGAVHDRIAYAESISNGATVLNQQGPARQDIENITDQIVEAFDDT